MKLAKMMYSRGGGKLSTLLLCAVASLSAMTAATRADTVSNIYTVVVSGGTFASPVSIESQQVEIYDADADTTTTEDFNNVTFKANSIFRKRGNGYMLSSLKMKNFTGEIRIEEGAFVINTNNQMGVTTSASLAPLIVVSNGASFVMATRENTCAAKGLKIYNRFQIAGDGCDGYGAICNDNDTSQNDYCFYRPLTLADDATIASTKTTRFDYGGSNCFIDLAGHQLTVRKRGNSGVFCVSGCAITNSASEISRIVIDNHSIQLQGDVKFYGDARSEIVFTNSAALWTYNTTTNNITPWTLRLTGRHTIAPNGSQQTFGTYLGNCWQGPIVLDSPSSLANFSTSRTSDGMVLSNTVSGAGSIMSKNTMLQLAAPSNSFTGSLGVFTGLDKTGALALWYPGSLPPTCAGFSVTNTPVTLLSKHERYDLPSTTVNVSAGTNFVFSGGRGGYAPSFRKAGLGRLDMENPLTVTGRAEIAEGTLKFTRYAQAGLVAGRFLMPDRKNFDLPDGTHWDDIWRATANSSICFTNWVELTPECLTKLSMPLGHIPPDAESEGGGVGIIITFSGYIWNRTGETQQWTFCGGAGTHLNVWLDSSRFFQYNQWQTGIKKTLDVAPGTHRFRIASYAAGANAYLNPAGTGFTNMSWKISSNLGAGFRYDPQGRGSNSYTDYVLIEDPGDGSLLTVSTNDTKTAVQDEPSFWTLAMGRDTTLDTFGNGIVVGDLEGLGTITNSNAYYVHPMTVTNSWTVSAADVNGGGVLRAHVPLEFAAGTTFTAEDLASFPRSNEPLALCTADAPITGLPAFDRLASPITRRWKLGKSADGRSILFLYSNSIVISFR